jgi:hypothetical protein
VWSAHAQTCLGVHRAELIIRSEGGVNGGWTVIVEERRIVCLVQEKYIYLNVIDRIRF